MTKLIIVTDPRAKQRKTVTPERAEQAAKVLAKHRNDLPAHVVLLLESPFEEVVGAGLAAARPLLAELIARKKAECFGSSHPEFEVVRNLLARANFALTGDHGDEIKERLHKWALEIIGKLPADILAMKGGVKSLTDAVDWVERIERRLRKESGVRIPRPTIITIVEVDDKEPRARKDKPKKTFAGLPPVQASTVDWDKQDAIRAASSDYVRDRVQGGKPQRGVTQKIKRDGNGAKKR